MKTRFIAAAAIVALLAPAANARRLAPADAYRAAVAELAGDARRAPALSARAMAAPVLTVASPELPSEAALYVFAEEGTPGFIIAAADDSFTSLIAYSDESVFDPSNVPPQLSSMLTAFAHSIDEVAAGRASLRRLKAPAKLPSEVKPLLQTKWGQDKPFNMYTPVMSGKQCPTGCVATAVAQIMRLYEWPAAGKGEAKYDYTFNMAGKTYSGSVERDMNNTYAWDQMIYNYTMSYDLTQAEAVSTLMADVGAASMMNYAPEFSGTPSYKAALALKNTFDYPESVVYYEHNWFEEDVWDEMMHTELGEGRPVYYSGDDGSAGHAFVVDGYSRSGYYHVNWGWEGLSDAYFKLNDLNPYKHGTGGSTGADGYNYNQNVLMGIQKPFEGAEPVPVFCICAAFKTNENSYNRNTWTKITFDGTFASKSIYKYPDVKFALRFANTDNGEIKYIDGLTFGTIDTFWGNQVMQFKTSQMPVGNWDVTVVAIMQDGSIVPFYYDRTLTTGVLHLEVTDKTITVTEGAVGINEATIAVDADAPVSLYDMQGRPAGANPAPGIYIEMPSRRKVAIR